MRYVARDSLPPIAGITFALLIVQARMARAGIGARGSGVGATTGDLEFATPTAGSDMFTSVVVNVTDAMRDLEAVDGAPASEAKLKLRLDSPHGLRSA